MSENPFWNLIVKLTALLAVGLLFLSAGLSVALHLGWTKNQFAVLLTVLFAVLPTCFALAGLFFSNLKLNGQLKAAAETAHQIAQGELPDENFSGDGEIFDSLWEIAENIRLRVEICRRVALGDLPDRIVLHSESDEVGKAFLAMVESLRGLSATRDERERLQKSVARLSKEVAAVAAGDLTVEARVAPELTGAIADAFNKMTKNLRGLIAQVKSVTRQIGGSANLIDTSAGQLARGSEAQNAQMSRMSNAIANIALQIQEVSENAALSARVADDSLINARSGTQAVQDNIGAMNSIRRQVRETAKRIKRLGERSQEISQIVSLIDDLSDRTSLLALNASLQASAAGEAGSGFAAHAEEVERLAERSNRLTRQISALTHTIQIETKDVVAAMEETIHEVVVGSTLADRAGQTLVEIERVSQHLADLIQSISASARQQAAEAEDVSKAMSHISQITELVQTEAKRAADSVKTLVNLSDDLGGSVASFRLPEDAGFRQKAHHETADAYLN